MILGIPNFKKPPYGSVTGLSETCGVYPQKMTINPCFLGYLIFRQTLQYILKLTKTLGVLSISIHFREETPCEESTGISASEVVDQLIIIFHDFPICSPLKDIWTIQISLAPFWGKKPWPWPKKPPPWRRGLESDLTAIWGQPHLDLDLWLFHCQRCVEQMQWNFLPDAKPHAIGDDHTKCWLFHSHISHC